MMKNNSEIFARRLRQARKMEGYSLRELSEKLEKRVSYNALDRYEKGIMMPSGEVLQALSRALGRPLDFFFRPMDLELEKIEFRKRTSLGKRAENAIKERARDFFERYAEVEELLDDARRFVNPLKDARSPENPAVQSQEEAEKYSDLLRKHWELGTVPVPNIHEMLEEHGIKVHEVETGDDRFDGFSAQTDLGPVVVVCKKLDNNLLRKRMTLVHELAHIVLDIPDSLSRKEKEAITSRFAGAFLLPIESFEREFGKHRKAVSLGELIEMKLQFGASIWAIMYRARQLDWIPESVYHRFCRVASQWRSEKKEPGDQEYKEKGLSGETHSRFRQLVYRAVAEGEISVSKGAGLLEVSLTGFRKGFKELYE
ncbi:MAG: XRE family transcriptional regulator [Balneolales bacterium]